MFSNYVIGMESETDIVWVRAAIVYYSKNLITR